MSNAARQAPTMMKQLLSARFTRWLGEFKLMELLDSFGSNPLMATCGADSSYRLSGFQVRKILRVNSGNITPLASNLLLSHP